MSRKNKKQVLLDIDSLNISNTDVDDVKECLPSEFNVLEVRTVSGSTFKNLLDTLKAVLTEANFIFTEKGLKVISVDTKKHAVVHLFMEANSFDFYYCGEKKVMIGIDIELLHRTIKSNKNNDMMCLCVKKDNRHVLDILFENAQKGTKILDQLSLKSIRETVITEQIKYPLPTELDSICFQNICREMSSFGATLVKIETVDNELIFSNKDGEPKRRVSVQIKDTGHTNQNSKKTVSQKGVFLLNYLKPFTKAANLSQKVRIYLKSNEPLTCEYSVDNLGVLKYLLSPEEQEDDE